ASASLNRRLAGALVHLAPPELALREAPIAELPLSDYALDDRFPGPARAFKRAIVEADALLLVTPEYNRSMPGPLKNAIDWATRPRGQNAFAGKPTAIIGASPGKVGTAVAQQHLRGVMNYCDARLMNQPEAYIQLPKDAVGDDGRVADAALEKVLRAFMTRFGDFVRTACAAPEAMAATAPR
ncbi:MAG: NADPH-dependent FMN reductase, partial [Vicinamibacterales bacterium]